MAPPVRRAQITEYDALGRVVRVTGQDLAVATTTWDAAAVTDGGNLWHQTITDLRGSQRRSTTGAFGQLAGVELIDASGTDDATSTYDYDVLGNLVSYTGALGARSTATFDWLSQKTSSTDPDLGLWSTTFDDRGLVATVTDARNKRITFTYDQLGRVLTKEECTGAGDPPSCSSTTTLVTYTYDEWAVTWPGSTTTLTPSLATPT